VLPGLGPVPPPTAAPRHSAIAAITVATASKWRADPALSMTVGRVLFITVVFRTDYIPYAMDFTRVRGMRRVVSVRETGSGDTVPCVVQWCLILR